MDRQNLTLLTDLYELTMMQGYFKHNEENRTVIFDAFYRNNPCGGGYAVMCGVEQLINYIKELHFAPQDIAYLRGLGIFDEDFLDYLAHFKFTGSIWAIPEGTVIFPREPLVKVVAPIMQAQLVETAILNIINHQSLIATKAARIVYAARGGGIMEFGLRRAQGPDAGTYGARAAVIAGCVGTSNVLCGELFHVPVMGTHAHSWIMSFDDELEAFKAYADLFPNACTLLVDTYDTLKSGVPNAIRTFDYMKEKGLPLNHIGIRLDSGDLAYLTKRARVMLDEAGYPQAKICASNDLDEYLIDSLLSQGAPIDSWGVGTNLITSKDNPAFGGV
ncbi:MAG: nicotinate phosphoribosyltransferase, partial [Lachnospiraceae bacterium]|nr:nicotinate phosphoribosyltransferase [Lachnospiraceae bacterium]